MNSIQVWFGLILRLIPPFQLSDLTCEAGIFLCSYLIPVSFSIKQASSGDLVALFRNGAIMYVNREQKISQNTVLLQDDNNCKFKDVRAPI